MEQPKDFEIKVLSEKVENAGQTGTDGRFAPGYPRLLSSVEQSMWNLKQYPMLKYMIVTV